MSNDREQGSDPYGDYDAASGAHTGGTSPYQLNNLPPGSWQEPPSGSPGETPPAGGWAPPASGGMLPSRPGSAPPAGPGVWAPSTTPPEPEGSNSTRTAVIVLSVFALLVIAAGALLTSLLLGSGGGQNPTPQATDPPTDPEETPTGPEETPTDPEVDPTPDPNWPAPEQPATAWDVDIRDLRDLPSVGFVPNLGGADSPPLGAAEGVWFAVSADRTGEDAMLHGVDADSGEELWRRELDLALCANEAAPGGEIICASAIDRDPGDFATKWRLHLLDPATGEDEHTEDIDLHVRAIQLHASGIVVIEDREPGPSASVNLYDFDLEEVWSLDLAEVPEHEQLFTSWAYSTRPGPWTEEDLRSEPLDLVALGQVGPDGAVLVMQVYAHAVLVEAATGELLGKLSSCFDLIDDGEYLWCGGALDRLMIYDYAGELVIDVQAEAGLRSGLLGLHPREGERILSGRPIAHNWDGELVTISPEDGSEGPPYGEIDYDSLTEDSDFRLFGTSAYSSGHRFAFNEDLSRMLMLEPDHDEARWEFTAPRISAMVVYEETAYVEHSHSGEIVRLNLEDGTVVGTWQLMPSRMLRVHDGELVDYGHSGFTRYELD
ncbi:hypothetical protein [Bogoriella caseilytica]|uniref:Uncharacterized protein n=1 Tax=Bogoriella caseilytica TaxID=56055 RepID=A0A3N2BGX0_9MICO|nr:hypothetical protein [Bogoriella caseilytica]ROR74503.1 hypothetical protein EDD31_2921 [Bogoriella caseilytica]